MRTELFVFIRSGLQNNTENTNSNNSQFYKAWRLKQDKVFAWLHTSLQSTFISQSIKVLQIYDHDWKSFAFSQKFRWQINFHENFFSMLCKGSTHFFLVFCTCAERFKWEKIMLIFSTILNLVTWPTNLVHVRSRKLTLQASWKWIAFDRTASNSRRKQSKHHKNVFLL